MYFELFKPRNWRKISAEARRRNCAVLPYTIADFGRNRKSFFTGFPTGKLLKMPKKVVDFGAPLC